MSIRVQNLTPFELQAVLDHAGSWKRFKEILGISHSELKTLQELLPQTLSFTKLNLFSDSFLEDQLHRIGSTELFCIIHRCKESELRLECRRRVIDLKMFSKPVGSTLGIGRRGELFFKESRPGYIEEDCFESQGHSAPYDFMDKLYKRVNVKTASQSRFKAKTRSADPVYWHFSTKGVDECDTFAFIPLDPKGNPVAIYITSAAEIKKSFTHHLILSGSDIRPSSKAVSPLQFAPTSREFMLFLPFLKNWKSDKDMIAALQDSFYPGNE